MKPINKKQNFVSNAILSFQRKAGWKIKRKKQKRKEKLKRKKRSFRK